MAHNFYLSRVARGFVFGVLAIFGGGSCGDRESAPKPDDSKNTTPDDDEKAGPKPLVEPGTGPETVQAPTSCERTLVADVVALSQRLTYNRLGSAQSSSQIFALARDVEVGALVTGSNPTAYTWTWLPDTPEWQAFEACEATPPPSDPTCTTALGVVASKYRLGDESSGPPSTDVRLRTDKRPRPLVLRANVGDCLEVNFANLLPAAPEPASGNVNTTTVGFHPVGLSLVNAITNDGQNVGKNADSQAASGAAAQYEFFASVESVHFVSSSTDDNDGMINAGLFGAVHVQPRTAEYYRSQVTQSDLALASKPGPAGDPRPIVDYQATYDGATTRPPWQRNVPILNMLQRAGTNRYELVYGDLTAIITGANAGRFADDVISPAFFPNPASPDRRQPFREFTIIYHEPGAIAQAFPQQQGGPLKATLTAGIDGFGINYGTGGIGAEILANRLGVGPMANCNDCRYEEFFLSSWAVGDPAMNVDWPASTNLDNDKTTPATLAYYPDDPSNVYHSYISDHVKMQLHHGGATHHVHHLHAHQWLHSPNSANGHYLDSQLFGPGSSFTLEIAYNGGGNRNQTVGDSIFHCHFYPHFAQGMWGMWRVHDVFEAGTELEPAPPPLDPVSGIPMPNPDLPRLWPKQGARALPDGEIARGTPIPGLVPLPTLPMAPLPSPVYISQGQVYYGSPSDPTPDRWGTSVTQNPGYPFFIPGQAGHRPPHPPMDFATLTAGGTTTTLDGGLPRHLVTGGVDGAHFENVYDFSKFSQELDAVQLPEAGTPVEKVAMAAHAVADNPSFTPEGNPGTYRYNGLPPIAGAPYAEPCPSGASTRSYRAADIQRDVVLNKDGWHNPQQRLAVLWEDIQPTFDGTRPPQPFFFRANSTECIEFWLTNLVPNYYELDNFQVRTPTDILGQHIHLVKFDVTSSDGAANGWNYEDGTFSYQEVVARIEEINEAGGIVTAPGGTTRQPLTATTPQYLCDAGVTNCAEFQGAQTTVQRWWADPLVNDAGFDRTIRTVFTHDHFGPSTHQQAGLYAGLLVEPENSTWVMAETDATGKEIPLGTRADGGPTSWQAVIKTTTASDSYREFALEFQDLALAYAGGGTTDAATYPAANETMTPAQVSKQNAALNKLPATNGSGIRKLAGGFSYCGTKSCKDSSPPIAAPPTPQVISSLIGKFNTPVWGTYSTNYRSEPLAMRLSAAPGKDDQPSTAKCAATDPACDTGHLFASIPRQDPAQNSQYVGVAGYPAALTSGVYGTDPFTPMLRAYAGEKIQLRTLVGAHVQMHNLSLHGMGWLYEPTNDVSGYRDSQSMGISEHFEMLFTMPPASTQAPPASAGTPTTTCGQAPSASQAFADYLYATSSSTAGLTQGNWGLVRSYAPGSAQCLTAVPGTSPSVAAWACPAGAKVRTFEVTATDESLTYNGQVSPAITNPNGLAYTGCDTTLGATACTPEGSPLVMRAAAGECITVTLTNAFDPANPAFTTASPLTKTGPSALPESVVFDGVSASPSKNAGLHPQLLAFDPAKGSGLNVGFNPEQTAAPGGSITYTWYAGFINPDGTGTPAEFGVVNLYAPDPLRQANIGLVGAMVVEPVGSTWPAAEAGAMQATVTTTDGKSFTDAVIITTETVLDNAASSLPILANYGTEPLASRGNDADTFYSNSAVDGRDPVTPIYTATAGTAVRLRVVHPWGLDQQVFELYGHPWQEEPYLPGSTVLGFNSTSESQGFRAGWGATNRLDVLLDKAGGPLAVPGDYLYRLRDVQIAASQGVWGILRVQAP